MVEWYYGKEGQQYGPIDEATLRARISTGEIGPRDLVWAEGMDSWKPLQEVSQLHSTAANPGAQGGGSPQSPYATPTAGLEGGAYQPGPNLPATNGLAIASMVCGILSLVLFCLFGGLFFGLPAVICGHLSLNQLNHPQTQQVGRGMAIAGLVCGYIGILILIALIFSSNFSYYRRF